MFKPSNQISQYVVNILHTYGEYVNQPNQKLVFMPFLYPRPMVQVGCTPLLSRHRIYKTKCYTCPQSLSFDIMMLPYK